MAMGTVAVLAGLGTMLFGVTSIVGAEEVSGTVDSEMRFYAVWYVGAGLILLRCVREPEHESTLIRGFFGALFVAGCLRALSWIVVGEPHVVAQVLMAIELLLPCAVVPWQAKVSGAAGSGRRGTP